MALFNRSRSTSFSNRNIVRLVHSGEDYFGLLIKLTQDARQTIYLQTYIFDDDETGSAIAQALMAAAKRGVQVYLTVDGYASQSLSTSFIKNLTDAGVHFRWFDPLLKSKYFYLGRRLHHKIVCIDGQYGLVGGINISNHYNSVVEPPWLDFALYVEGEAVTEIQSICERLAMPDYRRFRKKRKATVPVTKEFSGDCLVGVRINDWVSRKKEITNSYIRMLRHASSDVIIMSPYFIPDRRFMQSLNAAAKRGVNIKLILTGISDVLLSKYAERYVYYFLFRKNIEIYEYQKNVLHGKMAVCDKEWMTAGSYNINKISAYASIELNLEVKNEAVAKKVRDVMTAIIRDDCKRITKEIYHATTSVFKRTLYLIAYTFFRVMFFLFTFYYRQREQ